MLQAIAQNDERAFNNLFYEYHQQLGAFVFSITRSKELTEEIIQDVFVKLWENRKELPAIKNFSAWLFIITRNHTLNAIKKLVQEREKQAALAQHLALSDENEAVPEDNRYALL